MSKGEAAGVWAMITLLWILRACDSFADRNEDIEKLQERIKELELKFVDE